MSGDTLTAFIILAATFAAFISGRWRLDLIALISLLSLILSGILTPAQALAGFADPLVIMVTALFVVSGALLRTGVAERVGQLLARIAGTSQTRLLITVMVTTGLLSALMSTTGTVAVMLPIVLSLAWKAQVSPSKLLLPMVFSASLGAMLTLVATPPNIVVSDQLTSKGQAGFNFFAYTPLGLVMLSSGILFMLAFGRRWLVARAPTAPSNAAEARPSLKELTASYGLSDQLYQLTIPQGSDLANQCLRQLAWQERYQVIVLALKPAAENNSPWRLPLPLPRLSGPNSARRLGPDTCFEVGDELLVRGSAERLSELAKAHAAQVVPVSEGNVNLIPEDLGVVEVLLTPNSRLLNTSLKELRFRDRYRAQILAVRRKNRVISDDLPNLRLKFGDTILVQGGLKAIERLKQERQDLVVLAEPTSLRQQPEKNPKAVYALLILAAMLLSMTFGWLPLVVAALLAAVGMVVFGCLRMDQAYQAINWESVILIAAILPLATALQVTGGIQLVVDNLIATIGDAGPHAVLAGVFLLTAALTQVISNTTSAVLMAPIAFQTATTLDISARPLLMAVAIAASCAFISPVSSPVNTLVLQPGHYQFSDFAKLGAPMLLIVLALSTLLIPLLFPF